MTLNVKVMADKLESILFEGFQEGDLSKWLIYFRAMRQRYIESNGMKPNTRCLLSMSLMASEWINTDHNIELVQKLVRKEQDAELDAFWAAQVDSLLQGRDQGEFDDPEEGLRQLKNQFRGALKVQYDKLCNGILSKLMDTKDPAAIRELTEYKRDIDHNWRDIDGMLDIYA